MHKRKVWLLVQGDIFCHGLKVQLEQWGLQVVDQPFQKGTATKLTGGQEPALIIMDYKNRFSGPEASLLTSRHTVPILFLVAQSEVLAALSLQVQSINYYRCLPKPCPIGDLQKAVASLLCISIDCEQAPEQVVAPFSVPLPASR